MRTVKLSMPNITANPFTLPVVSVAGDIIGSNIEMHVLVVNSKPLIAVMADDEDEVFEWLFTNACLLPGHIENAIVWSDEEDHEEGIINGDLVEVVNKEIVRLENQDSVTGFDDRLVADWNHTICDKGPCLEIVAAVHLEVGMWSDDVQEDSKQAVVNEIDIDGDRIRLLNVDEFNESHGTRAAEEVQEMIAEVENDKLKALLERNLSDLAEDYEKMPEFETTDFDTLEYLGTQYYIIELN